MMQLSYPIYFTEGYGGLLGAFESAGLNSGRVCLVTDKNVAALYLDQVLGELKGRDVEAFAIEPGEQGKNLDAIRDIYDFFIKSRMDRVSTVAALGGGVVGDMAGFAAATFMRGVSYAQLPTTLLSQVDSSVGGKTGVDFHGHKNLIGAFYQPSFVYVNVSTLETLPAEQASSGMAEAIKSAIISDASFYQYFAREKQRVKNMDRNALMDIVKMSCRVKASVVAADEKENGIRAILNFGHTFGHAVETLLNFALPHGHCVALGMKAAMYMSHRRGAISESELKGAESLLRYFGLPGKVQGLRAPGVLAQMSFDKKSSSGETRLVLLESMGKAVPGQVAGDAEIMEAINYILE